jgi:hypothetical protein
MGKGGGWNREGEGGDRGYLSSDAKAQMSAARPNAQRNAFDPEFPYSESNYLTYSRAISLVSKFVIAVDLWIDDVKSIETGNGLPLTRLITRERQRQRQREI